MSIKSSIQDKIIDTAKARNNALQTKSKNLLSILNEIGLNFKDIDGNKLATIACENAESVCIKKHSNLKKLLSNIYSLDDIWIWTYPQNLTKRNTEALTKREKEVFNQMLEGDTNLMMSNTLSIQLRTVEKHVQNIFKKLQIKSRNEVTCFNSGWSRFNQ